jgi:membrane protease YdiL (CAAX protease family)
MLNFKNIFKLEERLVFFINFIFVLMVIFSLLYNISLKYFFYFNLITTFVVSFFFFKRSRKLAKQLIVTNLFIFFYFLYPQVAWFLSEVFSTQGYIFIIAYNVIIAYIFLIFSGYKNNLLGNIKKFNLGVLLCIVLLGLVIGLLFNLVKEPVPSLFLQFSNQDVISIMLFLIVSSFLVAFSEQMIFSGFLFNTYRKLTSKYDAFYQVSLIFVLFHLLRFEILVKHYFVNFSNWYLVFITCYYLLLFVFMLLCLYFYSFKTKKYEGNFLYPVMFHFMADLGLFLFYFIGV